MTIEKYMFWSMIQGVAKNIENISSYKEVNWEKNFAFKEDLDFNINFFENLLENEPKTR